MIARTRGRHHGERISVRCDIVPEEPPDSSVELAVGGLWALGVSEQEQSRSRLHTGSGQCLSLQPLPVGKAE